MKHTTDSWSNTTLSSISWWSYKHTTQQCLWSIQQTLEAIQHSPVFHDDPTNTPHSSVYEAYTSGAYTMMATGYIPWRPRQWKREITRRTFKKSPNSRHRWINLTKLWLWSSWFVAVIVEPPPQSCLALLSRSLIPHQYSVIKYPQSEKGNKINISTLPTKYEYINTKHIHKTINYSGMSTCQCSPYCAVLNTVTTHPSQWAIVSPGASCYLATYKLVLVDMIKTENAPLEWRREYSSKPCLHSLQTDRCNCGTEHRRPRRNDVYMACIMHCLSVTLQSSLCII